MKIKNKILVLALVLGLLCACGDLQADAGESDASVPAQAQPENDLPADTDTQEKLTELRLAYTAADTMNPYTMETQLNQELTPLLYDSLVRLDQQYRPENLVAEQVVVTGNICTIQFKKYAQFSDGTLLTGEDVIYSLNTAKASDTNWGLALQNVESAAVTQDGNVQIQLREPDADFAALLTFPLIKQGQAAEDYPTGISKYYVAGTWGNTGITLVANPLYYGEMGGIQTIKLVHLPDPDAAAFSLKTGDIALLYSSAGDSQLSSLSTSSIPVNLNRLVYLGVNGRSGLLAQADFRRAVSAALNRDELVSTAYHSKAVGTFYPIHPYFYRMEGMEHSVPRSLSEAEQLLDGLGYTETDEDGYRLVMGQPITLRLLVNNDNASRSAAATLIAGQLRQVGIKVEVVSQSFADYQNTIAQYGYDLYIGETKLMENMDCSPLLSGGTLSYAAPYDEQLQALYTAYRATGQGLGDFCEAFLTSEPFIPLLYREGEVSFSHEFQAEIVATEQDIFYNINEW